MMKTRAWVVAGVMMSALFVAGCGEVPGDGTGLEGKWNGSLEALFTAANVKLPIPVSPDADIVFDGGTLTVTLKPDIPVVNWFVSVVADGSYTADTSTNLDKLTLSLSEVSAKVLWFKIPLKSLSLTAQCIYTIKALNTLYIVPGYDKLPALAQAALEADPSVIPWETGVTVGGVTYSALKMERDT